MAKNRTRKLSHSPERVFMRQQRADLGLIKVLDILSRGTDVISGKGGFVRAFIKREQLPATRSVVNTARQTYDAVTSLAVE